ncbi:hypothetical protein HGRIS_001015 [Hohenbuehelia grisea]|uniref:CxC2-like cysteine cluster KDZ transposase-associated domain-containing protein n=1 Tax=Hohenbuehelia grisea TaxID=104357 RepID=A0ABR3IQH0_9AGAR
MKKSRKKQTNTTSARLREFLPFHDSTLEELIRLDGAGDFLGKMVCSTCTEEGSTRCLTCFMAAPQCGGCLVAAHRNTPLHRVERWTGLYYEKTTLKALGLRIQLGHYGSPCPEPLAGPPNFVVFDVDMAHPVAIDYCDCDSHPQNFTPKRVQLLRARWFPATYERPQTVFTFACLEFFHELSLQSKTTLYDYYHTLLRRTDNVKLYKQIVLSLPGVSPSLPYLATPHNAQARGIGHNPQGAAATSKARLPLSALLAPPCGAICQAIGRTHPSRHVGSMLYFSPLTQISNSSRRLAESKMSSSAPDGRTSSLRNLTRSTLRTTSASLRSILAEAIMMQSGVNTRNTPGFNVSGTVLVICARHAFVRKNGAGDLQKGERYCNVDYVVLSTLIGVHALLLVLSYDIACQWLKRLSTRIKAYPPTMHIPSPTKILGVVPRWHIEGHDQDCQSSYSFNYTRGVGKTCGEDIESTWSVSNQLCGSIREMGPGADILNDHWGGWNFQKLVGLCHLLLCRLREACAMTTKHRNVFAKFSATFAPTQVAAWGQRIREWEADSRKPNPYKEPETSETIHHVQLRLSQDEAAEAEHGQQPLHSKSPSKFLMEALELEEQQRNLKAELSTMKRNTTAKQAADMQSKRNTLFNRIQNFRLVQLVYMPCIAPMLASLTPLASITVATETTQNPSTQALTSNVESTPLLLPSSLTTEQRASISHLAAKEKDLQVAQADDSLAGIRRQRRILYSTYQFKKLNVSGTGNKPNTRVRAVFNRVNERISRLAERYRTAYQALCSLDPRPTSPVTSSDPTMSTWQHRLQPLRLQQHSWPWQESDEKNSDYTPSWIWLVPSARPDLTPDESEHEYDDAMRVEWSKTRARLERWEEEHILVQEEMRRTIQFLQWRANWWRAQGEQRLSAPAPLLSGLRLIRAKASRPS